MGYSGLLASLASTPAARRAILAGFFEPTEDERQQGLKVPGAAHRAIAALVARGAVRVILTTNFDRLIEQALEAEGVFPQVIATPTAIDGMEPLAHARCTVIKLHGDYARIDQLNTVEELSHYSSPLKALLDRVLDEYGLIINGWSGDWDHALVAAIEGTRSRRYPLYWSSLPLWGPPPSVWWPSTGHTSSVGYPLISSSQISSAGCRHSIPSRTRR
ncbi:SIR2 family protein [Micromonospora sediminicola]|uniref:SIR2 family protein n=1 Tax=Micromonospora sediminicola TaxID=946078 RepID=UPI0033BEB126